MFLGTLEVVLCITKLLTKSKDTNKCFASRPVNVIKIDAVSEQGSVAAYDEELTGPGKSEALFFLKKIIFAVQSTGNDNNQAE